MPTTEACLPIRLTAIASTANLPINLYFLGDAQAHSTNYSYVNPAHDSGFWRSSAFTSPQGWDAAVASAAREFDGRAFATDYAGETPSVTVGRQDVLDLASETDASVFFGELQFRGYTASPVMLELLARHVVPPEGTADAPSYFTCLLQIGPRGCGEPLAFEPSGLVDAIDAEITAPANEAQALVERHPYLTRLSTTMQPEDMIVDPLFELDADLPDVPRQRTATVWTRCSEDWYAGYAPQELEIEGTLEPWQAGTTLTEDAICRRMGGVSSSSSSSSMSDGGGCAAAANSQASSFVIVTVLGLLAMAFRRRRGR